MNRERSERLEGRSRKRGRRDNIQIAVLSMVKVAGLLALAAAAPNMFQVFPHLLGKQRYKLRYQTKTAVGRLLSKGFLTRDNGGMLRVTDEGQRHLLLEAARWEKPALKKKRWDGKYRLVLFDIPQRRRAVRDRLRRLMRDFGFLRLQDSVWVSPYDCEEIVALMKAELRVGNDVLYAIVNQIGNEGVIKEHFGLK